MASISTDRNGNRQILFMLGRNNRKVVRLGKVPMRTAEEVKRRIELLATAKETGISVDRETAAWAGGLESTLYDRLATFALLPRRVSPEQATLGAFIASYLSIRTDIKPTTIRNLVYSQRRLVEFFGTSKPLADVTEGDADEFRLMLAKTIGENTLRRVCSHARQFFQAAVKRRLIASNPFGEMKGMIPMANKAREYFVSRADAEKVLDACPNAQWRLVFALARYGGLRCPSEYVGLRWTDVDWERGRLTIHSPKTERHEGKGERTIPIFPELRPHLEAVWEQAEAGAEFIVTCYRESIRWAMAKIVRNAGLTPWPKLFQNLRSTRQTELAEKFPAHVVCAWMGNSEAVAKKHYLQLTDEHFEAAQKPAQYAAVSAGKGGEEKLSSDKTTEEYSAVPTCTPVSSLFAKHGATIDLLKAQPLIQLHRCSVVLHGLRFNEPEPLLVGLSQNFADERYADSFPAMRLGYPNINHSCRPRAPSVAERFHVDERRDSRRFSFPFQKQPILEPSKIA